MLTEQQNQKLGKILTKAKSDEDILAVILYGSRVNDSREETQNSDLDICLVFKEKGEAKERKKEGIFFSRKRLEYLSVIDPEGIDIQIFQQLPIYIRKRILEEGKVKYQQDRGKLYELAYRTIQEYQDFEPRFREYLEGVKNG